MWISKQSPIRCSGTRLGNTVDIILPMQNKNFSGNAKRAYRSSWSRRGNQKSFTLTIPWNLARPVKIFPGIIVRQHLTDRKQMGLLKSRTQSERRYVYCCNQVWRMNGGRILWNALPICETFKISCLMGGAPYEWRFGMPLNGPVIRFGAMIEYHPISAKDLSRLHQFGKNVLPGKFLGYVLSAGGIWKGDIWSQTLKNWRRWTHQNSRP